MNRRLVIGGLLGVVLLASMGCLPAQAASLTVTISEIEQNYQNQMQMARPEQTLAVTFCSAAETWAAVAGQLARQLKAEDALTFQDKAQQVYKLHSAKMENPVVVQLAGLNFLYQSLDILATLLTRQNQDPNAQKLIDDTERKLYSVVGQPGGSQPGPAMAALSGGVMAMLTVICGQVDQQGALQDLLSKETQRRRQVDANIYKLKETSPEVQMTMLTINHLFGALSRNSDHWFGEIARIKTPTPAN